MPLFRYLWFFCAAVMLANVLLWRRRLTRLVDAGTITKRELDDFLRGAALLLVGAPVLLGLIGLVAGWSDPFCAGAFSFDGPARAASSLVTLGTWAAGLWWVWMGNGADVLGRVAPALSSHPRYDRRYSPRLVKLATTGLVLLCGIGFAMGYRDVPKTPDGCLLMEQPRPASGP